MANIFDYMKWRDIDFKKVEFNEIDNLILSRLSYFPLDELISEGEEVDLYEVYERYYTLNKKSRFLQKEDKDMFFILADSERFGRVKITNYINKIDSLQEKQFSAVTIILPDDTIYIAYRGTDNTIVGWKEDFRMSFSEVVASQVDAVEYLERIAKKYKKKNFRIGGHSKGGNLAIYAAAFCNPKIQKRIINVYNNDGPGFCNKITTSQEYKNILHKVHTYIPQTSIIGRLLNHEEETTILKSTQTGIMQHDLYSWQVLGDSFVRDELTNSSELIDKTVTNWLIEISPEQRSEFFDILFDILNATGAKTFNEIGNRWFTSAKTMLKTYQNLDPESKEIMTKTLRSFLKIGMKQVGKTRVIS